MTMFTLIVVVYRWRFAMSRNYFLLLIVLCVSACGYNPYELDIKPRQEPMYNFTQSSTLLMPV